MNETPTPRTAEAVRLCKVISSAFGPMVGADDMEKLERELNESQLCVKASMESAAIASATIARLESERDQLREVADELALAIHTGNEHGYGLRIGDRAITLYNLYLLSAGHKKLKEGTK
jgi:hypothetical protein